MCGPIISCQRDTMNAGYAFLQVAALQEEHAILEAQAALLIQRRRRRRRPRMYWVRPWLAADRRLQFGHYDRLMSELIFEDIQSFCNYLRMPPEMFDELLHRLHARLMRQDTRYRRALEPGLKLAVTIRHLASGDKYPSLQYDFRVSRHTICIFIPEVCQAIVDEWKDEFLSCPVTPDG